MASFSHPRLPPPQALSGVLCSCLAHQHSREKRTSRKRPFSGVFFPKEEVEAGNPLGFQQKRWWRVPVSKGKQVALCFLHHLYCSHPHREIFNRAPFMEENFSIFCLLMVLLFVLDMCWGGYSSPLTLDWKSFLFFLF